MASADPPKAGRFVVRLFAHVHPSAVAAATASRSIVPALSSMQSSAASTRSNRRQRIPDAASVRQPRQFPMSLFRLFPPWSPP